MSDTPSKIDDGGPALNMTRRQLYAVILMHGILACEQAHPKANMSTSNEELTECALEMTDAIIAAEKQQPTGAKA